MDDAKKGLFPRCPGDDDPPGPAPTAKARIALVHTIQRASQDLLRVEEGSLYPALQRMLKAGPVSARWDVSPSGRRVRTYELSTKGSKHLVREMSSFERMLKGIGLVLAPIES